jgi:hypothetical protein
VRFATVEDLVTARRSLGPVIGERGFAEYVRATYGKVSQEAVRDFIRGQEPAQVFAAPVAADGKQATTGKKDSWLLDLISLPQGDPTHKYIMIAQNVYTSYLLAEPLESTKAVETAAAFQALVDRSPPKQGPPKEVTTDGSNTEWRGAFTDQLDALGIVRRVKQKEDRQAMAKLDATIQRVKALLIRPVVDAQEGDPVDDRPWSEMLPDVIRNYNERLPGPEGTFGSPPVEVIGDHPEDKREDNVLDFQVMRKNARALVHNTELNTRKKDAVMAEGAFRHGLPYWKGKFNTSGRNIRTKYSEALHLVDGEVGPYIQAQGGQLYNPKLIKPVPPESRNVSVPRWLQETGKGNRDGKREALWPWARQIHDWMKENAREDGWIAALKITQEFEDKQGFRQALADAHLGGFRMRDVERKPVGVMKLFSSWFLRKGENGQLWRPIGGDMPVAYTPEAEDAGDEDYMEEAEEVVAAPVRAPPAPQRRLRGIQPLGERFGANADDDLRTYLARLRAWLGTRPRQSATAAAVMRFLRRQTRYTAFARENPSYSKAVNVAAKDDALRVLGAPRTIH